MDVFHNDLMDNLTALNNTGKVQTYIKGEHTSDIELTVHHLVEDESWFAANKDTVYQYIPLWHTPANKAEAEAFSSSNNITVVLTEETDPDLTGFMLIDDTPVPVY
jgi:hypothetical protein